MSRCVALRYGRNFGAATQSFRTRLSWDRQGLPILSFPEIVMAVAKKSDVKEKGQDRGNGAPPEFTKEQELVALRAMLLIWRFEEKAGQLYGMGAIGGFCHLYIGQDAVVVDMQIALKMGDQVITGYRDHGHMLATGMEAKGVMAELTGRRGGYSKGKGGSMHMFSMEKNFFGGHGIVGDALVRANRFFQARHLLQHPGPTGRRHGRPRCQGGGRRGGGLVPRRQGAVHPGNADLSLS